MIQSKRFAEFNAVERVALFNALVSWKAQLLQQKGLSGPGALTPNTIRILESLSKEIDLSILTKSA